MFISIFIALTIVSYLFEDKKDSKKEDKEEQNKYIRYIEADSLLHQDNVKRLYYLDINGVKDTFEIYGDFKEVKIFKKQ